MITPEHRPKTQELDTEEEQSLAIATALEPIQPQKVYVMAADRLAEKIRAGQWPPGTRLPAERELSEMLGISRASVRQAIMALESIGVVQSKRGVGHFFKEGAAAALSGQVVNSLVIGGDPQELLEARRIVEPEVARLAAIYRDSDDLTRLFDVIDRMKAAEVAGHFGQYLEADVYFHMALGFATHNPIIVDLERVVVERMKAPPWRAATYTIVPKTIVTNREEHTAILTAVAMRKPRQALERMILHLDNITRNLRNISEFSDSH